MNDWSSGAWDGHGQRDLRIAQATPAQRLAWLESALRLAAASGALARAREERQRECDRLWASGDDAAPPDGG